MHQSYLFNHADALLVDTLTEDVLAHVILNY
jgi:hypothetical protein